MGPRFGRPKVDFLVRTSRSRGKFDDWQWSDGPRSSRAGSASRAWHGSGSGGGTFDAADWSGEQTRDKGGEKLL